MIQLINNPIKFIEEEIANAKERFSKENTPVFFDSKHLANTREEFLATYNELHGTIKTMYLFQHIDSEVTFKYSELVEQWKDEYNRYLDNCELELIKLQRPQVEELEHMIENFKDSCESNGLCFSEIMKEHNRTRNRLFGAIYMLANTDVITREELTMYREKVEAISQLLIVKMQLSVIELKEEVLL